MYESGEDEPIAEELLEPEDPKLAAARHEVIRTRAKEYELKKRRRHTTPAMSSDTARNPLPTPRPAETAGTGATRRRPPKRSEESVTAPVPSSGDPPQRNEASHILSRRNDNGNSTDPVRSHLQHVPVLPKQTTDGKQDTEVQEEQETNQSSDHEHQQPEDTAPPALAAQLDAEEWPQIRARARELRTQRTLREPSQPHSPSRTHSLNVARLQRRMDNMLTWENMVGFLAVAGRAPFSAEQYEFFNGLIKHRNNNTPLPEYKTVRKYMGRNLVDWCFPASKVHHVSDVDMPRGSDRGKIIQTHDKREKPARSCVRVVLPSDWAKLDVCTYTFYEDVFEHPQRDSSEFLSVEQTPIVQRRAPFIGSELTLWSLFAGVPCISRQGDTVSIPCSGKPSQVENQRDVQDDWFTSADSADVQVEVVFCGSWMIGHVPHLGQPGPGPAPLPDGSHEWTPHERALQAKMSRPSGNQAAMDTVLEADNSDTVLDADNSGRAPNTAGEHPTSSTTQTHLTFSPNVIQLYPGDHCVLLRTEQQDRVVNCGRKCDEDARTQHCVLVGSLVRQGLGFTPERLIWVDVEDRGERRASVRYVGSSNVIDLPKWVSGPNGTPHDAYDYGKVRNSGFLPDGSRYIIYRFALYMDGFKQKKSLRDQRSVGGCYILPLGLSVESRRGNAAPRVLTLCPDELEHSDVLQLVLEDISRAAKTGVDGFDPYGRRVRIFLDPVSFYADYPAAAECADCYGHVGNAYCTHCTVRKRDSNFGSKFLTTSMNNCRRSGFMRTDARLNSIRISPLKLSIYNMLGMESDNPEDAQSRPLVRLSVLLSRAAKSKEDSREHDLTPLMFDSSQSCAIAPDHMITGLIKNTLSVVFGQLDNDQRRAAVERRILSCAHENGLPVTGRVLRWDKHGVSGGLNNHTMTTLMCLLLCSAPAFEAEYLRTGDPVFNLPRRLHNFAAAVYYWPVRETDGDGACDLFSTEGRLRYFSDIREMACAYLDHCEQFFQTDSKAGAILDKPNAHRAVELAVHTIPTFGHARNCSEMVLESMHQVFKRWLEKNSHDDSHITAMERALTRDWMGRVYSLYKIWEQGNSRERACAELGLRRLLLGEEAIIIDERLMGATELKLKFNSALITALQPPVESMMQKCSHLSSPSASSFNWEIISQDEVKDSEDMESCKVFRECRATLRQLYKLRPGFEHRELQMYNAARLVHSNDFEGKSSVYKHNEVRRNSVISSLCAADISLVPQASDTAGSVRLFAVFYIARTADSKLWVFGKEMHKNGRAYAVGNGSCSVIQLGKGARRAGVSHVCDVQCRAQRGRASVSHSKGVCDGGTYEVWTRKHGYPPFMA